MPNPKSAEQTRVNRWSYANMYSMLRRLREAEFKARRPVRWTEWPCRTCGRPTEAKDLRDEQCHTCQILSAYDAAQATKERMDARRRQAVRRPAEESRKPKHHAAAGFAPIC